MARALQFLIVLLIGAAVPVVAVAIARFAAPIGIDHTDVIAFSQAAAAQALQKRVVALKAMGEFKGIQEEAATRSAMDTVLYVNAEGHEDALVKVLQAQYPLLKLKAFRFRPEGHGCETGGLKMEGSPSCDRGEDVKIMLRTTPLWHVAIVGVVWGNSVDEVILFKFAGNWYAVSHSGPIIFD